MSDIYGRSPEDTIELPEIVVRPKQVLVKELVEQTGASDGPENPLASLFTPAQAEPPSVLRQLIQSIGRDAGRFVMDTATGPYRAINNAMQTPLGTPLKETDPELLSAAMDASGLIMGGGLVTGGVKGALGSAGGKMLQPPLQTGPFYSAVEHAIANAPQAKMSVDQWKGWLRNQPGVKAEELDFMGLGERALHPEDWAKGPVTREQMLEHAEGHGVKIKEIEKKPYQPDKLDDAKYYEDLERIAQERYGLPYDHVPYEKQGGVRGAAMAEQQLDPTKFGKYQIPGGENYRETLLTLPPKQKDILPSDWNIRREPDNNYYVYNSEGEAVAGGATRAEAESNAFFEMGQGSNRSEGKRGQNFHSSHWDEPNVLVHMRMHDRDLPGVPGGKNRLKSLHLEEVQSDWHQKGRKEGYAYSKGPLKVEDFEFQRVSPKEAASDLGDSTLKNHAVPWRAENNHALDAPYLRYRLKGDADRGWGYSFDPTATEASIVKSMAEDRNPHTAVGQENMRRSEGVPDAPFKSTWADLALKRAITRAAREGYDAISWTPGAKQAERYDLSKQIKEVHYTDEGQLVARDHNGNTVINKTTNDKDLPDLVGKEIAQKLISGEGAKKTKWDGRTGKSANSLEGLDLKVGGEGMHKFYDKMLVDKANALGKKYGAKVEWQDISPDLRIVEQTPPGGKTTFAVRDDSGAGANRHFSTKKDAEDFVKSQELKIPVFRLNDQMKEAMHKKGMPLFSAGVPFKFTPVEGDPFAEKPQPVWPPKGYVGI